MRTALAVLGTAGVLVVGGLGSAAPAAAFGSEQLGCYVGPSHNPPAPGSSCNNANMPSSTYTAVFVLSGLSGSYSYAWSVPAIPRSQIQDGCTSTASTCTLGNLRVTGPFTVSVTITQDGQSRTLSADADIEPWCGNYWCG